MEVDTESTQSERKLSTILKHPLRRKSPNDSPIGPDHEDKGGLIRASIDKLKDHHSRHSADKERRGSFDPGKRLSKLVPGHSKRKKSRQLEDDAASEASRGRTEYTSNGIEGLGISSDAPSEYSLGSRSRADSVTSSLLTDDEDVDPLSRPGLDTRPSHAGYLTLSSPYFTAEPVHNLESVSESALPQTIPSTPATPELDLSSPKIASSVTLSRISEQHQPSQADAPGHRRPLQKIVSPLSNEHDTPSTFVTPPTPDIPQTPSPFTTPKKHANKLALGDLGTRSAPSSPPDSVPTRRLRSATTGFGKISNPLTPAIEEAKTPGGSFVQPAGSGSFFTSVFSATQNAVNQISNSFANVPGAKNRNFLNAAEPDRVGSTSGEEVIVTNSKTLSVDAPILEPAIATLGSGNLSLSHLGISETYEDGSSISSMHISNKVTRSPSIVQNGIPTNKTEEGSAAEAVTAAYVEKPLPRDRAMSLITDPLSNGRPRSIASAVGSAQGETTPPASVNNGVEGNITRRSNSVRSRLSERRRRHRNSSVTNGSAIGAAIGASHAALANPGGTRPSGFAVASTKRNKDFHQLFKSVPEDDYLVEDCSAALQRDILLQGRLYVSERHVCFSSNILGWVTNLVISFDEILAMEKKMTALVFPNAIMIQTLHAKNTFASLIGRETTYDLLIGIWRTTHPNLKVTEFGHSIDNDADGKAGALGSSEDSEEESDEFYNEDEDEDGAGSFVDDASSHIASDPGDRAPMASGSASANRAASKSPDAGHTAGSFDAGDLAGPLTHAPTECSDQASHFDKQLMDTTIPAPLGKIYSMMFGPLSGVVMRKFLLDDQKSGDLQLEDDKKGLGEDQKSNSYSFIKPLGASIGPKQTKCVVSQTLDFFDLEKAVSVTCSTQTPDVPSGNAFVTKTKYCLMWGPGNSTRLVMNCTVEWSAKSWLKGPIEKGANEGQDKYGKDIVAFFKAQVSTKSPTKSLSKSTKGKGRRKKSTGEVVSSGGLSEKSAGTGVRSSHANWGFLEPVRGVLGPVGDILGPLVGPEVVLGALLFVVTLLWLRSAYWSTSSAHVGKASGYTGAGPLTPQRLAAYEELWRREESDLWTWLEDRIGLDGLEAPLVSSSPSGGKVGGSGKKDGLRDSRSVDARLDEERMSQRQVEEAIKVTEEKLEALKRAVERRRGG